MRLVRISLFPKGSAVAQLVFPNPDVHLVRTFPHEYKRCKHKAKRNGQYEEDWED